MSVIVGCVDWPLPTVVTGRALVVQGRGVDTQVPDMVDNVVQGGVVELLTLQFEILHVFTLCRWSYTIKFISQGCAWSRLSIYFIK